MNDTIITVENLSKRYRLGTIGATSLRESCERTWHRLRGHDWRHHMGEVDKAAQPAGQLADIPSAAKRQRGKLKSEIGEQEDLNELWALKDVSFEVKCGEVLGVIGRNGAGKSTLLKLLSRITEPTSGRAIMRGRVASLLEVGTGFHPELTGRENVYLNGAILGMRRIEIAAKFDEIVAFSEVERFIDTPVKRYSSGMYVRLAFAVAAHLEPEILLVDEVLAVGDVEFQKRCLGKMKDVAESGRTVLFVSHNLNAVSRLTNTCINLAAGKLVHQGETRQVVESYVSDGTQLDGEVRLDHYRRDTAPSIARFVSVEVNDALPMSSRILFGTPLKFSFDIHFSSPVERAALSLGIKDRYGAVIMLVYSPDYDTYVTTAAPAVMRIQCEIPSPSFMPGKYIIQFAISPGDFAKAWDVIVDFPGFEIATGGERTLAPYTNRPGLVHSFNVDWALSSRSEAM